MSVSEDGDEHRPHRTVRYRLRHQQNGDQDNRVVDAGDNDDDHENDDDELEVGL